MSLRVWLPLNKDLHNQGLSGELSFNKASVVTFNSNGYYDFSGYTGNGICSESNSYQTLSTTSNFYDNYISNHSFSLCCWAKTTASGKTPLICLGYGVGLRIGEDCKPYIWLTGSNGSGGTVNNGVAASTTLANDGEWHHIVSTYNIVDNAIKIYVDGVCEGTAYYPSGYQFVMNWKNAICVGRDPNNSAQTSVYFFQGSLYDVKIYGHALSAKEVKDLSKGLYLHYTFANPYVEDTVNYAPYPSKTGDVGAVGWDQSKHVGAITVNGWSNGYNSGVTSPSVGYHACWKIIDDIPTMVFTDRNSSYTTTHRWLGISSSDFRNYYSMSQGTTYTISFDAKSDVNGKCISGGFWYQKSGQTGNSGDFNDGMFYKYVTTDWQRYSATFTVLYGINNYWAAFYFYGYNQGSGSTNPEATSYVRNVQVEIKDHATPYTPSSRSSSSILRDNSGFGNDGIINNALLVVDESRRYDKSTKFTRSNSNYIYTDKIINDEDTEFTVSAWVYPMNSSQNYLCIFCNSYASSVGFDMYVSNTNAVRFYTSTVNYTTDTITNNTWHHLVWVWKSGTTKRIYIDGNLSLNADANPGTITGLTSLTKSTIGAKSYDSMNDYFNGCISDLRVYKTALSEDDVVDLYKTSCSVDKNLNLHCYELNETVVPENQFLKTGVIKTNEFEEESMNIYLYRYDCVEYDDLHFDYLDYYIYCGEKTIYNGQLCYIWHRICEDIDWFEEDDTGEESYEKGFLSNSLNLSLPFSIHQPEYVAKIVSDLGEQYENAELREDENYRSTNGDEDDLPTLYRGLCVLEYESNGSKQAKIYKNGTITANEIYED